MKDDVQYFLKVENNQVVEEEGNFFPAIPFTIFYSDDFLVVKFERGRENRVVYRIFKGNELLDEWTYPDYVSEIKRGVYRPIGDLSLDLFMASLALVKLGIIKEKNYLKELRLENLTSERSFVVEQEFLLR